MLFCMRENMASYAGGITYRLRFFDNCVTNFDVLLTLHLSIILAIDQLNAQILVL